MSQASFPSRHFLPVIFCSVTCRQTSTSASVVSGRFVSPSLSCWICALCLNLCHSLSLSHRSLPVIPSVYQPSRLKDECLKFNVGGNQNWELKSCFCYFLAWWNKHGLGDLWCIYSCWYFIDLCVFDQIIVLPKRVPRPEDKILYRTTVVWLGLVRSSCIWREQTVICPQFQWSVFIRHLVII